jgi:hypothetical protein
MRARSDNDDQAGAADLAQIVEPRRRSIPTTATTGSLLVHSSGQRAYRRRFLCRAKAPAARDVPVLFGQAFNKASILLTVRTRASLLDMNTLDLV